ncbi:2-C-methyl-D-erythritol 4-phosphate cytidylyltransferase 1 [Fervidicola ferrireducens]|uniref:2-C-methyl-D-erythritol 4-phosphate cytidylyltransferase n=1 Tax=Fervidicola ferrireducens TaxID=520764 RepID=A0A140L3K4_9FIRM|nr:2-C-methyl-D-erythritol 4-phosphate cytidylyltransferase [Fervidicola ferrireducens]KXG75129.1 2-C-methyl-D-erythritol 4-phosphate cytidylyltransferase 1 [Fervidicola ferrireducens]
MKVAAVIAAGGRGRRMNSTLSKQFLMLKGRPILYYTLNTFESLQEIDEIILVVGSSDIIYAQREILQPYRFRKVKLVEGGKERQDSVYNGLRSCSPQTDIVVIHDGVRPFVTRKIILDSIEAAKKYRAVGVGVPVKDTIKVVDKGFILNTPDRKTLWAIQTPQTFEYSLILKAHEEARKSGFYGTDDTVLVERLGFPVRMIEGAYENIKITTPEDMIVAEAFLNMGYGDFKR